MRDFLAGSFPQAQGGFWDVNTRISKGLFKKMTKKWYTRFPGRGEQNKELHLQKYGTEKKTFEEFSQQKTFLSLLLSKVEQEYLPSLIF